MIRNTHYRIEPLDNDCWVVGIYENGQWQENKQFSSFFELFDFLHPNWTNEL